MNTIFKVVQDVPSGLWCVCRGDEHLLNRLSIVTAIRFARKFASDEHAATSHPTKVVLSSPEVDAILAQHA
jgi:hypothetical protein